jgi:hypothetical protein
MKTRRSIWKTFEGRFYLKCSYNQSYTVTVLPVPDVSTMDGFTLSLSVSFVVFLFSFMVSWPTQRENSLFLRILGRVYNRFFT